MGIYDYVKEACASQRYSIRSVERLCSFPEGTIKRWRTVTPGIDKVIKVADLLQLSLDELCGRTYYVDQAEKRSDAALEDMLRFQAELNAQHPADDLTEEERSLVRAFRKMSDAKKLQLLFSLVKLSEDPQ